MTWMHWVLFGLLALFAVAVAFEKKTAARTRLVTFSMLVGMIVMLILGQPK